MSLDIAHLSMKTTTYWLLIIATLDPNIDKPLMLSCKLVEAVFSILAPLMRYKELVYFLADGDIVAWY